MGDYYNVLSAWTRMVADSPNAIFIVQNPTIKFIHYNIILNKRN